MRKTCRPRQQTNKINVNVCKPPLWNWDRFWLQVNVLVNLSLLAAHAAAGDGGDVPPHVGPAKGGGDQACRSLDPWVMHIMDGTDDRRAERRRYERSEDTSGNVA